MVYEDSSRMLENVISLSSEHIQNLMKLCSPSASPNSNWLYNPSPIQRTHHLPSSPQFLTINPFSFQEIPLASSLAEDSTPVSKAVATAAALDCVSDVYLTEDSSAGLRSQQYVIGNQFIEVTINERGAIISLLDKRITPPRQVLLLPGNNLMLYEDIPLFWDAWDVMPYHLMTGSSLNNDLQPSPEQEEEHENENQGRESNILSSSAIKSLSSEEISLEFKLWNWGNDKSSAILMAISLSKFSPRLDFKLSVEWHESHKLLKVEFPLAIQSSVARYETQFGFTDRPTHGNHATDAAMFEVCGHRYASLSETGYGVALLNTSKYGQSCRDSTLCLSLLRAPKSPDPNCDMGTHVIQYALYPHLGSFLEQNSGSEVIAEAILYNTPLIKIASPPPLTLPVTSPPRTIADSSLSSSWEQLLRSGIFILQPGSSLILDTIKRAEAGNDQQQQQQGIIVRFYESLGARGSGVLDCLIPPSSASFATLNEVALVSPPLESLSPKEGGTATARYSLPYKPFQVITLKFLFD
jgi:alpha-mannosidase